MSGSHTRQQPASATTRFWAVLLVSAVLEAVWALTLDASAGFTVLIPTLIFIVANPLSLIGLAYAMRGIGVSIAYAIWTGLGAALTVSVAMLNGSEPVSVLKLVFLAGILGCVIGLKFAPEPKDPDDPHSARTDAHA